LVRCVYLPSTCPSWSCCRRPGSPPRWLASAHALRLASRVLLSRRRSVAPRSSRDVGARCGPCGRPFHGVLRPFDVLRIRAATDALASRRVCLTRLRGASRLSQPLDALLRAYPLRPCFMPVTPMGFMIFRGFPSGIARPASRTALPLSPKGDPGLSRPSRSVRVLPAVAARAVAPRLMRSAPLDFEDLSPSGVRSPRTGFTRDPRVDSSLDLHPLRGLPLERSRPVCFHTRLLSWASPRCFGGRPPSP
jgi:hypothetical protein